MRTNFDTSDTWSRHFLNASSLLNEPFCKVWDLVRFRLVGPLDPTKFDNCSTRTKEIAVRTLIVLGAALGVTAAIAFPVTVLSGIVGLSVSSKILRFIGYLLQKEGFMHIRGAAKEKTLTQRDSLKVMSWNICGIGGGLSKDHGGVIHWRHRLEDIISIILTAEADVLILQEIYDTALGESLIQQLKSEYAHFFTHLGPNVLGSEGGCMMLSKYPIHKFTHTSFENNDWSLNRGFATLEIKATPDSENPFFRIIGTHLIHGDAPIDQEHRKEQINQIVDNLSLQKTPLPTILAGDLNIERDKEEGKQLSEKLTHGYTEDKPTCTNELVAQWDGKQRSVWGETIDYISLFKKNFDTEYECSSVIDEGIHITCNHINAFDDRFDTQTALSDHHALKATVEDFALQI